MKICLNPFDFRAWVSHKAENEVIRRPGVLIPLISGLGFHKIEEFRPGKATKS